MSSAYLSARAPSPSFAQTGGADTEYTLFESDLELSDVDDNDDLRLEVGDDAYELAERNEAAKRSRSRRGGNWDDDDDDKDDDDDDAEDHIGNKQARNEENVYGRRNTSMLDVSRRASVSSIASFQLYTPDENQTVKRKLDRNLVIFVALLYMLSFLDRSNIGNARIAGMETDLQTDPPREDWYEWSLTAFYITYIAFEWMSLLWKLVPAHIFISVAVLSWGIIASLQAIAPSYPVLVALRTFLGVGEAAFAGIPFYLSFFFKRDELAFRTAIFISAAPLATSFASTLAWVILKLAQRSPIAPWRLLFLIEGFPSVIVSVIAWNMIPDNPQSAAFLTKREKRVARLRLRREKPAKSVSSTASSGLKLKDILAVLLDPVAWITATMFFLTNMAYSSLPVFLPKILTQMGHSPLMSQALAAPPFLISFIVVLVTAHISDRYRSRTIPIVIHALFSTLGYAGLAVAQSTNMSNTLRYIAVYPAAIGFFNVVTMILVWSINNQKNQSRQGGGFVLLQLIGQCGPLVGTRLYPDRDGPYYTPGMRVCAGAMLSVTVLAIILRFYLIRQNRRMDREEQVRASEGVTVEEEGLVSDGRRPSSTSDQFRYML